MPPRAQRLYPRMRERPPEFRVNPAWPLWNDLLFFVAPGHTPHTWLRSYGPHSYDWNVVNISPNDHLYDPFLRRFCVYTYRDQPSYIDCRVAPILASPSWPHTALFWAYWTTRDVHALILIPVLGHSAGLDMNVSIQQGSPTYRGFAWGSSQWTPMRIAVDPLPYANQWHHLSFCYNGHGINVNNFKFRLDGAHIGDVTSTGSYAYEPSVLRLCHQATITNFSLQGMLSDVILLRCYLSDNVIAELADPSNVDIRVNGTPLILPPRRRLWPVAPVAEYIKHRQLGLRVGSREAVT